VNVYQNKRELIVNIYVQYMKYFLVFELLRPHLQVTTDRINVEKIAFGYLSKDDEQCFNDMT